MLCLESNFLYRSSLYALLAYAFKLQLACFDLVCVFCAEFGLAGVVDCYDFYLIGSFAHLLDRSAGEGYVYVALLGPAVAEFLSIIKEVDIVC